MADFNEEPTLAEALQFKKDNDARVEAAREGMGYAKKVEAPVEETETETPVEDTEEEVEETETEEEETTEEVEQDEEDENSSDSEFNSQTRDKTVFRQLNEIRSQKRAAEAEKEKALADYAKLLEENKALKANQPPPQPFVDFANEKGITDPKGVKDMYDLFRSQMEQDFGSKISELDQKIQSYEAKEVQREEQGAYTASMEKLTDEWRDVLPVLEGEYKPSSTQLDEAFTLMSDLAHSQKYHDKELDYILFKESDQFENIFGARKRRTMFSSHGRAASSSEGRTQAKRDGSHESIMALKREMDAKKNSADGWSTIADSEI